MEHPYQRKVGDFEIRILPDGKVVFVAPDQEILEIAENVESENELKNVNMENAYDDRTE